MKESGSIVILFVEDDDGLRLTLREYFEGLGYRVLVAADGVSAIKHLLDTDVDIIVTDYRMDILGGNYWIRFLQRYCAEIPVILTSGFLGVEDNVPFELLQKPFEYSTLAGMITRLIPEKDREH